MMDNKDYNEPMNESVTPENENVENSQEQTTEEQYAYNQFESTYGNDPYASDGFANNNYYGDSGYTNIGGKILDSNGKELKDRFGLKLTFAIIEMICCCCGFFLTPLAAILLLIAGILGCVFTCMAHNAFKEGRYDDFKTKAKVSFISLIAGVVAAVISLVIFIVSLATLSQEGFWDEFMTEFEVALEDEFGTDVNMDTFWEDLISGKYDDLGEGFGDFEGDYVEDYNEDAEHENFEDFNEIIIDGMTLSLPCTYADLQAAGFYLNASDLLIEIESESSVYLDLHSADKAGIAFIQIINEGSEACKAEDGTVIYMCFYYAGEVENDIFDGYEFVNGANVFLDLEETMDLLGEPNYIYKEPYEDGDYEYYAWYYETSEGYDSWVGASFIDGEMYSFEVNNGPEEYY